MISRREMFCSVASVGAASMLASHATGAESSEESIHPAAVLIDTNVSLFQWPFRRLPLDQTDALAERLRSLGIAQAWAGSFEGLLHRDITGVNERLVQECERAPGLVPFGSINPKLPGWQTDLRACAEKHQMPGIRLHPNYHGYKLSDPEFLELLKAAATAGLFVQLAVAMEDTRTHHPMLQVADVDLRPLPRMLSLVPAARIQLLNHRPRGSELTVLEKQPNIFFDTARVEGTDGIASLIRRISPQRVMLGTHAPFLIPEAALIRVLESNLSDEEQIPLLYQSAQNVLASSRFQP